MFRLFSKIKTFMKKILLLLVMSFCMTVNAGALTYEEAFEAIKAMPNMKGVEEGLITGDNDFTALGITDGQLVAKYGETMFENETEVYGNRLFKLFGELPVSEVIQAKIDDSSIMAIFAKPVGKDTNRILILSDSGGAGFTGALVGYINDRCLDALRKAILVPRESGGTAIYVRAVNF